MTVARTVCKAVIPAAGKGTRFLPATKAQPKEMLPIIDTPTIQYVVEEAMDAGLDDILIITSREKRAVEDHFDRDDDLLDQLARNGSVQRLATLKRLDGLNALHYIRQKEPRGLGHAIGYARNHVAGEPFAVLLGDSIVRGPRPCIGQLAEVFARVGGTVIGLERVPAEHVTRYGIVAVEPIDDRLFRVTGLVEKPSLAEAPSDLAIGARYVLTPDIFEQIDHTAPGKGGEIQLTDALQRLLDAGQPIFGYHFEGKRHDIGSKLDFLKTTVEFALQRDDLGGEFRRFLKDLAL